LEAVIDPSARLCRLSSDGAELTAIALPSRLAKKLESGQPIAVEFGLCDRQVCLAFDGERCSGRQPSGVG
jgi:hypothetical protein